MTPQFSTARFIFAVISLTYISSCSALQPTRVIAMWCTVCKELTDARVRLFSDSCDMYYPHKSMLHVHIPAGKFKWFRAQNSSKVVSLETVCDFCSDWNDVHLKSYPSKCPTRVRQPLLHIGYGEVQRIVLRNGTCITCEAP